MKIKYMHEIKLGVAVMAAALVSIACSDKWDDHYNENNVSGENLWAAVSSDADLTNFSKVVKACGYDVLLNGSNMLTVFAPINENLSVTTADSLIAEYNSEKSQGVKDEDNEVVKQFLYNHIALYNKSVSSITSDSIMMLNGKYQFLTSSTFGKSNLQSKNSLYKNGVLFTIDRSESYFPNVFEYIKKDADLDSISNFIYGFNEYVFDEENSVPGDIVDGKTQYLDSVVYLTNSMLSELGRIDREDSTYWLIAPTNRVWKQLYDKYNLYYNYDDKVDKRDSLSNMYTCYTIIGGAFFNMNEQKAINDSALSTNYSYSADKSGEYNPYFKYYRPFDAGGIFTGTSDIECSNGKVMKTDDWKIDEYNTLVRQKQVDAEWAYYQDTIQNAKSPLNTRTVATNNKFYNKVSNNQFVEVEPFPSGLPAVRYKIPYVLSNVGYDIFVVFAPATAYDAYATKEQMLPAKVRFYAQYNLQNGRTSSMQSLTTQGKTYIYETQPDIVDTIQVASDYKFPTCSYGLNDEQVTITIRNVTSTRETDLYTRSMRIDCIILKPHKEDQSLEQ